MYKVSRVREIAEKHGKKKKKSTVAFNVLLRAIRVRMQHL